MNVRLQIQLQVGPINETGGLDPHSVAHKRFVVDARKRN